MPAADVSAMDGFALAGPPPPGRALAGRRPDRRGRRSRGAGSSAGAALRIMTGAPLPEGADRVVPVEQSRVTETDGVETRRAGGPRRRPATTSGGAGEVMRAGDPLLPAGALLTPGALSVLATHGHDRGSRSTARPRVALVVTGDEVVPPDTEPGPGKLRDSHTDFVLAACRTVGHRGPARWAVAPDEARPCAS